MIDLKTLYELGIPRLPELTGPAMKAANKAVSNGAKPAAIFYRQRVLLLHFY